MSRAFAWSCAAVVAAGFVALAVAWQGSGRVLDVGLQVPQMVSGGLAGLGLVALGLLVWSVQSSRVASASEREALGRLADRIVGLAADAAESRSR